ncbi:MAG: sulfur carrier protein ThiS [Armatimonadota bacterium]|nr:sulfur carrier protein ThiS [Armatimonadota bacterium]MDR7387206.1 sulfur carrier protein ThiS [Armatimonadota bacterium]MDR7389214.1 sulfur carrier protein ThiS [Armatimonadota bacterium]MDR7391682.1 sulfur carrier protein ThiS [Armatimonadota bacterium]MDR7393404.1 sulfur carrier protein ThiS [Armatimonadota bacterium]
MSPRGVQVWLNGQPRQVPEGSTLADLLGEPVPGVAAAVNGEVVPRQRWRVHRLQEGDRVEFVQAVQGG